MKALHHSTRLNDLISVLEEGESLFHHHGSSTVRAAPVTKLGNSSAERSKPQGPTSNVARLISRDTATNSVAQPRGMAPSPLLAALHQRAQEALKLAREDSLHEYGLQLVPRCLPHRPFRGDGVTPYSQGPNRTPPAGKSGTMLRKGEVYVEMSRPPSPIEALRSHSTSFCYDDDNSLLLHNLDA